MFNVLSSNHFHSQPPGACGENVCIQTTDTIHVMRKWSDAICNLAVWSGATLTAIVIQSLVASLVERVAPNQVVQMHRLEALDPFSHDEADF